MQQRASANGLVEDEPTISEPQRMRKPSWPTKIRHFNISPDWNRAFPKRHRENHAIFDLQTDIIDRALPDALQLLLVQQTEALEALLHYAQGTIEIIRTNGDMSPQEQTTRIDGLAKEVSERLIALEDQHIQMQTHMEELQRLLRQQGNPILAHTVERVKDVLVGNLIAARQQLDAIIHGQS